METADPFSIINYAVAQRDADEIPGATLEEKAMYVFGPRARIIVVPNNGLWKEEIK